MRNHRYKRESLSVVLRAELRRLEIRSKFLQSVRMTVVTLLVTAAAAVLTSVLFFPVLRIYGSSMSPSLSSGDIVIAVKNKKIARGDMVAFYYGNKVLIKRCIATAGEFVDIDPQGGVSIDGEYIEEDHISEKALGECDIELPYQVPEKRYFVMGDHRSTSIDSRSSKLGCVSEEQIIGKIIFVIPRSLIGIKRA